jgi:gliding motility-associated-like protein
LLINEVCVSNYDDYLDNFGEFEDWFEIYNPSGADIDLNGYYLSDDITEPTKFEITASVTVPAGGYRVVYASDRGVVVGNNIHTTFKINQSNQEYAVLADPGGVIVDAYWLEQTTQTNHSHARLVDGDPDWGVQTNPTPGAANAGGFDGYSELPVMDLAPGEYPGSIDVNISHPDPTVELRYGLNGTEPTAGSPLVAGPITVDQTTVIHVRAYPTDPNLLPSIMETNTYFINENHTLPIFSMSGPDLETLLNGTQIAPIGTMEYFGPGGVFRSESRGDFNEHGNDSWAYDQRGVDYIGRDQFGYQEEIEYPIFRTKDRPSFKRLILKAAANDNYPFSNPPGAGAHVIDAYIHSLSQIGDLRMDERSHEPCIVYLNGQYWGVYDVREKVDDLDFTDYYYDQGAGEVDFWKTWGGTWNEYDSGTSFEWDGLVDFITTEDMTDPANYDYVKSVYNTGSLIDYFVLNSYVVTSDWLNWNTGWWRGRDPNGDKRKWRYILWDNDASFGQYVNFTGIPDTSPGADPCDPETIGDPGGQGHVPILNALMGNEEFYNDYVSRFADLSQTLFSCDVMIGHLDSLVGLIEPEMQRQVDRWGGTVAEWQDNVQVIRDFINDRCAQFEDGMLDCYDVTGPFPLYIEVQPPGAGWVEFNSLDLTEFPFEAVYYGNLDVEMEANAYGVNVFSHWELNNHVLTDFNVDTAFFTFETQDTIVAWFVSETSDIILDVEPDDVGSIKFNNTLYSNLPETISAPEGVELDIIAIPEEEFFVFDYWETEQHAILPDMMEDTATITIDTTDVITAVFRELDNYQITIGVEGGAGGYVIFEGDTIWNYPFQINLLGDSTYTFGVVADEYWTFIGWIIDGIPFDGDLTAEEIILILSNGGTISAQFEEDENFLLTYMVDPLGQGTMSVDGVMLDTYPTTIKYYEPDLTRQFEAFPLEYHEFVQWSSTYHEMQPDERSAAVSMNIIFNDTITAHFMQEMFGFYIPTAFSPNGDGVNDVFGVQGNALQKEFFSLEIFDRWGNLVFESKDIQETWNGSAREGAEHFAPDGNYVFRLKVRSVFDNGTEEAIGNVLLIR